MRRTFFCFLLFAFLVSSNVAFGLTGRCRGKIIKEGVSKVFLINNCGEPDQEESNTIGAGSGATLAETLYYYDGSKTWIVEIRRGKVTRINKEAR